MRRANMVSLGLFLCLFWVLLPGAVHAAGVPNSVGPDRATASAASASDSAPIDVQVRPTRPVMQRPGSDGPQTSALGPATPGLAKVYTVRSGDSLFAISDHFGITLDALTGANGLTPYSFIWEGMQLIIPYSNEPGTATYGPNGPVVNAPGLHFVVSISEQSCWLFKDQATIAHWPCSTGRSISPTIPGNYTVQSKMPDAWGAIWEFWMPYWLGIYNAGTLENGIHGLPYSAETGEKAWTQDVGTPITYGCVMLDDASARALYNVAYIGMPVTVLP